MRGLESVAGPMAFTGERVVPGAVDPDLWNEHVSRYRFASRFAQQKKVLDLGCGTGYGADLLSEYALHVTGIDSSAEAIVFAAASFSKPDFLTASGTELPFSSGSFELVTAFELIEHLSNWPLLVSEAARVLAPEGIFLVSTPNKLAYAEARGDAGPNPFHLHEFGLEEFQQALARQFPFVRVLGQNHNAAVVFSGATDVSAEAHIPAVSVSAESHFFIAICAHRPVAAPSFVYVPAAANLLWERESHIQALQSEMRESRRQFDSLLEAHRNLHGELDAHNAWALSLHGELIQARTQLRNNDAELVAATASIEKSRAALEASQADLADTQSQLAQTQAAREAVHIDLANTQSDLTHAQAARHGFEVRLQAAQQHNDILSAQVEEIRNAAWIRLGRTLKLGPYSNRRLRASVLTPSCAIKARAWAISKSRSCLRQLFIGFAQ